MTPGHQNDRKQVRRSIETELKYTLQKAHYESILRAHRSKPLKRARFTNCYLDTPDFFLAKLGIGLRIRLVGNSQALVTVKRKTSTKGESIRNAALSIREEHERSVPYEDAVEIVRGKRQIGTLFRCRPVKLLKESISPEKFATIRPFGSIATVRTELPLSKPLVAELDRFVILGRRHYELELETRAVKTGDAEIRALFRRLGIPCRPERRSKLGRLVLALRNRRPRSPRQVPPRPNTGTKKISGGSRSHPPIQSKVSKL